MRRKYQTRLIISIVCQLILLFHVGYGADLTIGNTVTVNGNLTVTGTVSQSTRTPVLNSGQMITYATGDDGNLKYGAVVTGFSRFTDNGDGTVTDNLTSLIWLKNVNCYSAQNWTVALAYANTLASPSCGLSDSSAAGDWRLPNLNELKTLVDYSQHNPALPTGYPFTNVQLGSYWSSTTSALDTTYAWAANTREFSYEMTEVVSIDLWSNM